MLEKMKAWFKGNQGRAALYEKAALSYNLALSTISPRLASEKIFKQAFGRKPNWKNAATFSEKLMWLKLNTYNNNPLVTMCADKYRVREYIEECGCGEILNDLIGVWDDVDEIDWGLLPDKFALKCNHGYGYNIICDDKSTFDFEDAKKKLRAWMKEDFWKFYAEVHYKNIEKKIIAEKYIGTDDGILPLDYKVLCFGGEAKFLLLHTGRGTGSHQAYYFDREWKLLRFSAESEHMPAECSIEKPQGIDKVFEYAEKLSAPFPFVRADFYLIDGRVIFGELTFTPSRCVDTRILPEVGLLLGQYIVTSPNILKNRGEFCLILK